MHWIISGIAVCRAIVVFSQDLYLLESCILVENKGRKTLNMFF